MAERTLLGDTKMLSCMRVFGYTTRSQWGIEINRTKMLNVSGRSQIKYLSPGPNKCMKKYLGHVPNKRMHIFRT